MRPLPHLQIAPARLQFLSPDPWPGFLLRHILPAGRQRQNGQRGAFLLATKCMAAGRSQAGRSAGGVASWRRCWLLHQGRGVTLLCFLAGLRVHRRAVGPASHSNWLASGFVSHPVTAHLQV